MSHDFINLNSAQENWWRKKLKGFKQTRRKKGRKQLFTGESVTQHICYQIISPIEWGLFTKYGTFLRIRYCQIPSFNSIKPFLGLKWWQLSGKGILVSALYQTVPRICSCLHRPIYCQFIESLPF